MSDLIEMRGITKQFGGINALTNATFSLQLGEVHALLGENGAGKSTLMGVLSGRLRPDQGQIFINGELVNLSDPAAAIQRGIGMIQQEIALAPDLSVAENIFLGKLSGIISWKAMRRNARDIIESLGFDMDPNATVGDLSIAYQQIIEIAKALSGDPQVLIFDEPTATLGKTESDQLLTVIDRLRTNGVSSVYISHRLEEVFQICDRFTVMKDGQYIGTGDPSQTDQDTIIKMMVGRQLHSYTGRRAKPDFGDKLIDVRNLSGNGRISNISFSVRSGEVMGLGGLVGAGRTDVARLVFGADERSNGEILLGDGAPVKIRTPADAVRYGIGMVPEDRKGQGAILEMSYRINVTMSKLIEVVGKLGFVRARTERAAASDLIEKLGIKISGIDAAVSSLSGGNQQKTVLAKWFFHDGPVIFLDEPTRGVDVGAKTEIYKLIAGLAKQGKAVIVISSEHHELFRLCDRILIMREGELSGELFPDDFSEEKLLYLAMGKRTGGQTTNPTTHRSASE